jgi:hypothetical protein
MWYEFGKEDKLINLDRIITIQMRKPGTIGMVDTNNRSIYLQFEDEGDACEAFQFLRMKLLRGDDVQMQQVVDLHNFPFDIIGGDE